MQDEDADDSGADTFMFEWLVSQQLHAAQELAPKSAEVWTAVGDVALQVLARTGDEGQEFHPNKVVSMFGVACNNAASTESFKALMAQPMKTMQTIGRETRDELMQHLNMMLKGNCGRGQMGRGETSMPTHRFRLENPSPYNSKCSADQSMRGDGPCLPQLQLKHHELWPTRIATTKVDIPGMPEFHKRLSEMAISKYLDFTEQAKRQGRQRLEDINNAFFSAQDKSERPGQRGMQFWAELYTSKEYKLLLKVLKNAAVDQAMKIGKYRTDRDKLMRESSMVLWAAVYTTHTPHLTHVHESSAISGTLKALVLWSLCFRILLTVLVHACRYLLQQRATWSQSHRLYGPAGWTADAY